MVCKATTCTPWCAAEVWNDLSDPPATVGAMKLTYNDKSHIYTLDDRRAKGVTAVAKMVADSWTLERWAERMVAIGITIDDNLRENVATHLHDKNRMDGICEDAKKAAKAHEAADRGTQMHRVLQLVLLDQEDKLLTDQQRRDAAVLRATLARYQLRPHEGLIEQFVAYPEQVVCGRFDAVLQRPDGSLIMVDLKSGPNAVAYPQSTAAQLALYRNAPYVSDHAQGLVATTRETVTSWRQMPENLDREHGYVLLVPPDADVGTLYELDITHGWAGAQLALQMVMWRKGLDYGKDIATEVGDERWWFTPPAPLTFHEEAAVCTNLVTLRTLWDRARHAGALDEQFKAIAIARAEFLWTGMRNPA